MFGYLHSDYAQSLAEFGTPRFLPRCEGWILERQIPGFSCKDAMGCYPLFFCQDWLGLEADLEDIRNDLVSLSLVTDPFGKYSSDYLRQCFLDVVIPFKEHFIVDLQRPSDKIGGSRRRKHARRALKTVQVEVCEEPKQFLDTWVVLYNNLIERHGIKGIRAFSKIAFAKQLSVPGTVVLRAVHQGRVIGAQIYYHQDDVVQCHLGAVTEIGYEVGAFYALDWFSFEFFRDKAQWLDLGAGAGLSSGMTDGLSQYKREWSSETRTTFFCGRIFNREKYAEIEHAREIPQTSYFPAYRLGEFG